MLEIDLQFTTNSHPRTKKTVHKQSIGKCGKEKLLFNRKKPVPRVRAKRQKNERTERQGRGLATSLFV